MFTLEADTFTSSGIAVLPKNGTLTFSTGIALITKLYIPVDKSGSLKSNSYTLLKKKTTQLIKKIIKNCLTKYMTTYLSAVTLNLFLDITTLLFSIADSTPTEREVGNGSPSKFVKRTESVFCISSKSPIGFTSVAVIGKWY